MTTSEDGKDLEVTTTEEQTLKDLHEEADLFNLHVEAGEFNDEIAEEED